jgi:hypothetical protein
MENRQKEVRASVGRVRTSSTGKDTLHHCPGFRQCKMQSAKCKIFGFRIQDSKLNLSFHFALCILRFALKTFRVFDSLF